MFRCDITKQLSKPGEKPYRLIVERRERTYTNDNDYTSHGWEIARELQVGLAGLKEWVASNPHDRDAADLLVRAVRAEELARQRRLKEGAVPQAA